MIVPVPTWNARGVIDPANPIAPTSAARSPYRVSLREFAETFGTSARRVEILQGFLGYRAELHSVGLVSGFQWLDGSFLEQVELLEHRDPNDIDVVTFYDVPTGGSQLTLRAAKPELFPQDRLEQEALKKRFRVDAYLQMLATQPARLVSSATYWYSMWSHRRDLAWKGFVEVDLAPGEDHDAGELLKSLAASRAPTAAPIAADIIAAEAPGLGEVT